MNEAADLTIDDIYEGATYSFDILITTEMIDAFAALSGDKSPIHINEVFAKKHGFAKRVAHGGLIVGFISRLIGMYCPGRLAVLHALNIKYHHPTHPGDEITVCGTIEYVSVSAKTIMMQLSVRNKTTGILYVKGKSQIGFLEQ